MSRMHFLFGLLVIVALVTAGCTGMKTTIGTNQSLPADQLAAQGDYKKCAGELKDEIDYLANNYKLSNTAMPEEYRAWLDGFRDRLDLTRHMYNNTSAAAKAYLGYLNGSSAEYRNVTSDDVLFRSDIDSLNRSYWQYSDYLNTSIKKLAALNDYKNKLNASQDVYRDLTAFTKGAKIGSMDEYTGFIDGFGGKARAYEKTVDRAIAAGDEYVAYLQPGSAEYAAVQDNDKALLDNLKKCQDAYANYKKDYDAKAGARAAAQSAFKGYTGKIGTASSAKKDVDAYYGTARALDKLDQGWLTGYKQKIDAFDSAANDAIASGNACKQYLNASSPDYAGIADNEKNLRANIEAYDGSYRKLETTYRNLHPLGSMLG